MRFYTNFQLSGSSLLVREVIDGVRSKSKVSVKPSLYVSSKSSKQLSESGFVNMAGEPLSEVKFGSVKEAKEFLSSYKSTGYSVYGFDRWAYSAVDSLYPGDEIQFSENLVNVLYLDLECECENGFPSIENGDQKINAITVGMNGKTYTLGLQPIECSLEVGQSYKCFDSEEELLSAFIKLWKQLDPDIVTGWNVTFFDLPYIFARMGTVLGEDEFNKLSPWGSAKRSKVSVMGREQWKVAIVGVSILDYLDLYKKFRMKTRESYKLDFICSVELGEEKLDYSEFKNLHELYRYDYTKFIRYNIKDVTLVMALEEKLKYINLAMTIAYFTKTNYSDVFSNVRIWDVVIASFLRNKNILVSCNDESEGSDEQYEGAVVKPPIAGKYDWAVSFDFTSLYPSLIRTFNIGPDTYVGKKITDVFDLGVSSIDADFVVNSDKMEEITKYLVENDYSMAANGTLYRRDKIGFLADLMATYFRYRKTAKKEMLGYEREIESINKILETRGV